MNLEKYTLAIGKIIVNLHSLEFALRTFLWNHEDPVGLTNWHIAMPQLQVGQTVPVNALSNFDTLGKLIEKFNEIMQKTDSTLSVDQTIVDLRDALAHGRIWAEVPQPPMQLVKFDKPNGSETTVTHAELIDSIWLDSQKTRVWNEIEKVRKAGQTMQPGKCWASFVSPTYNF